MNQFRRIFGWGSLAVFSAISVLQAVDYTCPGATDLVLRNGVCKLQETKFVCVPKENSFTFRSCVPGKTTSAQMGFCSSEGEPCFSPERVDYKDTNRCSSDEASDKRPIDGGGLSLAQSVPCE